MKTNILGKHLLIEMQDCNYNIINSASFLKEIFLEAAKLANCTVINSIFHQFEPQGASGIILIAESHFSVHTYPEYSYCAIDLFTCGESMNAQVAISYLKEKLESNTIHIREEKRGLIT